MPRRFSNFGRMGRPDYWPITEADASGTEPPPTGTGNDSYPQRIPYDGGGITGDDEITGPQGGNIYSASGATETTGTGSALLPVIGLVVVIVGLAALGGSKRNRQ